MNGISYNRGHRQEGFDWDTFWHFTGKQDGFNRLLYAVHYRHYQRLLQGLPLPSRPRFLELGAGSGTLARQLVREWNGSAVLVDNNATAVAHYRSLQERKTPLSYVMADVFALPLPPIFDVVYSDGLIEHFVDKQAIFEVHRRAIKPGGYLMLLVPHNSPFFRTLTRFGPDMGYEERYTLPALVHLVEQYGLTVLRTTHYPFAVGVLCQPRHI